MIDQLPLDRRIQRTRKLLHDALFQLIIERGYEAITIQDITEQANLGRTTFYLHYQDKADLFATSIQTLMDELQRGVEPMEGEQCPYQVRCVRIFAHIAQHQQVYRALLQEAGAVDMGKIMRTYFAGLLHRYLLEGQKEARPHLRSEMIAAHAAGALFGLIVWWLDHDSLHAAETMGTIYFQLMATGATPMLDLAEQGTSCEARSIS